MTKETLTDDWSQVFRERGFLVVDKARLRAWIAANQAFFKVLGELFTPDKTVLDVGSGPGRHACGAASLGYRVIGIDLDPQMVAAASANALAAVPDADIGFHVMDLAAAWEKFGGQQFDVITHGGLLEHLDSAADMQAELRRQLACAHNVVFDVPVQTPKNRQLFAKDDVFRHVWTADRWLADVLGDFRVRFAEQEVHAAEGMTDDLIVWLSR